MRSLSRLAPAGLVLVISAYSLLSLLFLTGCSSTQLDTAAADLHAGAAAAAPLSADLKQIGETLPTTQPAKQLDTTAAAVEQIGVASGKLGDAAQVLADSSRKSGSIDLSDPNVQKAISGAVITAAQATAPSQAPQIAAYTSSALAIAGLLNALAKSHGTIGALVAPVPPPKA